MAGRILEEDIDALKRRADLVDIVSDHTNLKRSGSRWKGLCPFHQERTPSFHVDPANGYFHCLSGETGVMTLDGDVPIVDLAGGSHELITTGGAVVTSQVRSFGTQRLYAVHLRRSGARKTIYATDGHRWLLRNRRGPVATRELRAADALAYVFKDLGGLFDGPLSPLGVAHGLTFGERVANGHGSRASTTTQRDRALLRSFPSLPCSSEQPPPLDAGPGYLLGWLSGYVAADGRVSGDGQVTLSSARREDLEFVRTVATRLGLGTYGIECQHRIGLGMVRPGPRYSLTFVNSRLRPRFFLHEEHRRRYERAMARGRVDRPGWVVTSVEPTDRVEEVFCAVVPGTHTFALEDNILTHNCFGCQAGGDVYTFLQDIEGLTFVEAVEQLARRTGYELRYEELTPGQKRALGRRSRLVAANEAAAAFFQRELLGPEGEAARTYLKERGFGREEAERFRLGFAPNDWDRLSRHLAQERFTDEELTEAGLAKRGRRGSLLDTFRGRLVFPILDLGGDAIGFGGRVVPGLDYGDHDPPKYLNSPETPVFKKHRVLYGMSWARPQIVREGQALVCEGYTDVMALHRAGLGNAVATCGTAVGEDHVELLQRYADRIVLAFDPDDAGARAAERAWELSRERDLEVRVLALPPGRDPADVVGEGGAEAMRALVGEAEPVIRFMLRRAAAGHDPTPEGRAAAVDAAAPLLAGIPDLVLRDQYTRWVADELVGIGLAVVARAVGRAGGDVATVEVRASEPAPGPADVRELSARAKLEREALATVLQRPDLLPDRWQEVTEDDLVHPRARSVFRAIRAAGGPGAELSAVLSRAADDEERTLIRAMALEELTVEPDEPHVAMLVNRVLLRRVERDIAERKAELEARNPTVDADGYRARFEELIALEARRRDLNQDVER